MSEWLKEHAWKACMCESASGVRIPLSPPFKLQSFINIQLFFKSEILDILWDKKARIKRAFVIYTSV